jgi:hypothetical protein
MAYPTGFEKYEPTTIQLTRVMYAVWEEIERRIVGAGQIGKVTVSFQCPPLIRHFLSEATS